jgi:hypothetical protein
MARQSVGNALRAETNEHLLYHINKLRREHEHYKAHKNYGTGQWVSEHEFWGRKGEKALKSELKRRQKLGKISPTAGKKRKLNSLLGFGKMRW